jgi:hypothetical protein
MTMQKFGGEFSAAESYRMKLKCVGKLFIINEILVEAAGVGLIKVLRACRLLILVRCSQQDHGKT